jgi:hypothetical protein
LAKQKRTFIGGNKMSDADAAEAKLRAEWLHKHKAPQDWIILTGSEVSTIQVELETMQRERDAAIDALMKIEDIFIDGDDTYEDWKSMGQIARTFLEDKI